MRDNGARNLGDDEGNYGQAENGDCTALSPTQALRGTVPIFPPSSLLDYAGNSRPRNTPDDPWDYGLRCPPDDVRDCGASHEDGYSGRNGTNP